MIALRTIASPQSSNYDLVLIHAFPLASAMYDDAVKELQKDRPDLTVHLVDLPGFGKAPYREHWTIAEAMRSLHEVLQEKTVVSPIVGGTSMGGYAVLAYYRLYPEKVRGLILSNTKAAADDEEAKKNREVFAQDVEKRGHEAVYERMLDKLISDASNKQHPELRERLRLWIGSIAPRSIASALRALALREDSTSLLGQIGIPTVIISGSEDALIPPSESKKMNVISNSHFITIAQSGHLPVIEAQTEWVKAVSDLMISTASAIR